MHADSQEQPTLRAAFRVHTAPCIQVRINTPKDPMFPGCFRQQNPELRFFFTRNLQIHIHVFLKYVSSTYANCVIVIFSKSFITNCYFLTDCVSKRRYLGKMFGIYANFSLGTQKIFYGALTHYMSYYYFKGYAYTCIEWHVGVFLYFHRLPKFLDTHDTLRISRMNIS